MNTVRLPRAIIDDLIHQAQQSPQEEICGLISRDQRGFRKCYPVPNLADDKQHFFSLDPKSQIDALRAMREQGEELAAIYHSHPDSPAFPSPADVAQHEYSDVLYFVVSLHPGDKPALRGFRIHGQTVEEIVIETGDDARR